MVNITIIIIMLWFLNLNSNEIKIKQNNKSGGPKEIKGILMGWVVGCREWRSGVSVWPCDGWWVLMMAEHCVWSWGGWWVLEWRNSVCGLKVAVECQGGAIMCMVVWWSVGANDGRTVCVAEVNGECQGGGTVCVWPWDGRWVLGWQNGMCGLEMVVEGRVWVCESRMLVVSYVSP